MTTTNTSSPLPEDARFPDAPTRPIHTVWRDPARPWQASVIGYFCVVIGYLGFLLKGVAFVTFFLVSDEWIRANINPEYVRPEISPQMFTLLGIGQLSGVVISLVALVAGFGMLKMRRWGLSAARLYAISAILATLIQGGYRIATFDDQFRMMVQSTTQPAEGINYDEARNRHFFGITLSSIARLTMPIAILALIRKPHVTDRFV